MPPLFKLVLIVFNSQGEWNISQIHLVRPGLGRGLKCRVGTVKAGFYTENTFPLVKVTNGLQKLLLILDKQKGNLLWNKTYKT